MAVLGWLPKSFSHVKRRPLREGQTPHWHFGGKLCNLVFTSEMQL
jgi:hypothetical protein